MSYRPLKERRACAVMAEAAILADLIPGITGLKDLVEQMQILRKRNRWWKLVGSKRSTPWSKIKTGTRGMNMIKGSKNAIKEK